MQEDLHGDALKERYYPNQLHLVSNFNSNEWEFEIEEILKERKNPKTGKKEYFVRYLFYPGKIYSFIHLILNVTIYFYFIKLYF